MAYSGAMSAIKQEYDINNVIASLPLTLYYAFYAAIQFLLAAIMKRINLKLYMVVTFIISGLSFVAVFFFSPMWFIGTVLSVNGITLGAVWCGSIAIFGKYLSQKTMNNTLLAMMMGFSIGSALSYGVNAIAAAIGNWRFSFIVFGVAFLLSTLYFIFSLTRVEKAGIKPTEDKAVFKKQVYKAEKIDVKPLISMAIIILFISCVLYYAFMNFMPTILEKIFGITKAYSNLITTTFPLMVYVGPVLAVMFCNRLKDDFLVTFLGCFISTVISLILCLVLDLNFVLTVAIILFLGISLRMLNSLFISLVPLHTRDYVNSGKSAAIINAVGCIAAAVSPSFISLILDVSGNNWELTFWVLFMLSAVMLLISGVFWIISLIIHKAENNK